MARRKRSKQTLSHYRLLTGDMGNLYPVGLVEALPGDTFRHRTDVLLRLAPMAAPIMHPVVCRVHHFFVPHRLTWPTEKAQGTPPKGWEAFITGGPTNEDAQLVPQITAAPTKGTLLDYLGLPISQGTISFSALPIRAYNMIFNEWYRDQDLVEERAENDTTIAKIAWEKDYYSAARPWPQKGPATTLPLGVSAPVVSTGQGNLPTFRSATDANPAQLQSTQSSVDTNWANIRGETSGMFWEETGLETDLSSAQGVDILTWRNAFALQRFAEARARYGSRYTEYLSYLGVRVQDMRLQRPELLGSGSQRLRVSEVLQTANETTPGRFGVGDLYGHGVASGSGNAYQRYIPEHGYIMSLLSVRPKAMYLNGMERTWMKTENTQFWQRELQHVGQQELLNGEVLADGNNDTDVWGYTDRYQEYRFQRSGVSGDFRDQLKYWHMGRDFGTTRPGLNSTFVECDATKRIFNVTDSDGLWIALQHRMVARRLIARDATPRVL